MPGGISPNIGADAAQSTSSRDYKAFSRVLGVSQPVGAGYARQHCPKISALTPLRACHREFAKPSVVSWGSPSRQELVVPGSSAPTEWRRRSSVHISEEVY